MNTTTTKLSIHTKVRIVGGRHSTLRGKEGEVIAVVVDPNGRTLYRVSISDRNSAYLFRRDELQVL